MDFLTALKYSALILFVVTEALMFWYSDKKDTHNMTRYGLLAIIWLILYENM